MECTKIDNITIYNCDCMDLLKQTTDNHYDLAIVDPPYGINWSKESLSMSGIRKDGSRRKTNFKWDTCRPVGYVKKAWDKKPPDDFYFEELFRVSKRQIIWGGNYFNLPLTGGWIIWDKQQTMPSLSKCEMAWTSFLGHSEIFHWQWAGMLKQGEAKNKKGTFRIHPTEKPVALYKWLLKNYGSPDIKVLDTHLGSGSHAVACYDMGFELTACELDKDYYNAAVNRLKIFAAQIIFDFEETVLNILEEDKNKEVNTFDSYGFAEDYLYRST